MARPTKWRKVEFIPNIQYFAPINSQGNVSGENTSNGGPLEENILRVEELEALRLRDIESLDQEECANKMEISRQTFQRILGLAREKVTDSLINGKAIRIEGGNFTRHICPVKCLDCGREWNESYENFKMVLDGVYDCPECSSKKITCARGEKKNFCRGYCWRYGRGGSFREKKFDGSIPGSENIGYDSVGRSSSEGDDSEDRGSNRGGNRRGDERGNDRGDCRGGGRGGRRGGGTNRIRGR